MKQHLIDLMPASIRARSQAGLRTSRFIAVTSVIMLVTIMVATHSRVRLTSAQNHLAAVKSEAEAVFALEARAAELRQTLEQSRQYINVYERVAYPIEISAVIATVVNALPSSVTLEQVDIDAGSRAPGRSPRARGVAGEKPEALPRVLTCEISGFAASDQHIAELINRLEGSPPLRNVNLDFTRTRKVNELDAREFRLSFKIDLNARYLIAYADGPDDGTTSPGLARGQGQEVAGAH